MTPSEPRKFLVTLGLSADQLALIGKITAQWSVVEWMLMRIAESLLSITPEDARILAVGMGAVEKIKVVRLLAHQHLSDEGARAELFEIRAKVDDARIDRNDIAHGIWTIDKEDGGLHLMKYRGGKDDINRIKGSPRPMTDDDLESIDRNVRNALGLLLTWRDRYRTQIEVHTDS